jgi:DNA-binding protein H-NS
MSESEIRNRPAFDLDRLTEDELTQLIDQALDRLPAQKLTAVREAAETKRRGKMDEARVALLEKWRTEAAEMGLSLGAIFPAPVSSGSGRRARSDSGSQVAVKYRGPNGETWTGRGRMPKWLAALEADGRSKEEFRVA